MTYLLDTNVLSETRKTNRNPGLEQWIGDMPMERLHLSVITVGEVEKGIAKVRERGDHRQAALFESWLDDVVDKFGERIVPVTTEIAREWGTQSGRRPVSIADALIAATARVHNLRLVTRNVKDFEDAGVRVLNPFTD
ncbi:MAG TPA: type II toxin-antitoxin system VapC family toxin [Actinophytocola sp.]|uniref:type II toxin-antitoxin system VapC family toxin n=1 Tax=Actinophytocola sp. TaxID=1872138 RepID=UPI002DDDBA76|nr:type II toxin-antitoxin system VapC family toxin [Actinophytocola sp.]HEV2784329.1 type II toxin-antitoxin system VapC family toxin [Actinophytocola sp.]